MDNKTETYIILKPISERFSRISSEITDDEIKSLIKNEMRNQLEKIDFYSTIQEWIDDYLENHPDEIMNMFSSHLKNKFK